MEDRQKKFVLGAVALGILGAGIFWATSASAKGLTGDAYVLQMFKTKSYKVLSPDPNMPIVEPLYDSPGQLLIDWAIGEQKKGRVILVPTGYYKGTMAVSPSQIVSIDSRLAPFFVQSGVYKTFPSQVATQSTGAAGDAEFPWGNVAIGVAALGVVGGGAYYFMKKSEEEIAPVSETDVIADAYLRRLEARRAY